MTHTINKKRLSLFLLLFICLIRLNDAIGQDKDSCFRSINKERIYARERAWVYPSKIEIQKNPPSFKWPVKNGDHIQYKMRLSQDSLFSSGTIIESKFLPWAVCSPHDCLKDGVWYWQYGWKNSDKDIQWSSTFRFKVDETANKLSTPNFTKVFSHISFLHPRLWVTNDKLIAFRNRNNSNREAKAVIKFGQKILKKPLPEVSPIHHSDTSGMSSLEKKLTTTFNYHGFGKKIAQPIKKLSMAFMLTDDSLFAKEGIKRAMQISKLDPDGVATRDDFNSGACMEAMAIAYDRFYEYLSERDKKLLLNAIQLRGNDFYNRWVNNFESKLADNHIWQHLFREFVITAVATAKDLDDAKEWLEYAYEVWTTRFPILGTTDGGWYEGNGYFPVQFETLIYLPLLFGKLTGINYFKRIRWFRNLPFYMIYTFPPNSVSTGIGDKHEQFKEPSKGWVAFANALSKMISNPYFNKYVEKLNQSRSNAVQRDKKFLLFRLLNYDSSGKKKTMKSLKSLPKSRVFRDIGLAVAHSSLGATNRDLMVSLSSSPFGVIGHAHAAQNSLTINWRGINIFGGSGYYSNFSDLHNLLHYRTSRAYSTILADSIGQSLGESGYGWIPRFITGQKVSYFVGDASNAYTGKLSDFWRERINRRDITINKSNGFGKAGVKKFRRHVLVIEGKIIVVYDVLKGEHPIKWTWQLHSQDSLSIIDRGENNFTFLYDRDQKNVAKAYVFSSDKVEGLVHDKFNSPAINWKGKIRHGKKIKYSSEWHAGVTTNKAASARFLSVFVVGNRNRVKRDSVIQVSDHTWKVGDFVIKAGMKSVKSPFLLVKNNSNTEVFGFNIEKLSLGDYKFDTKKGRKSILLEKNNDKVKAYKACDILPSLVN